MTWMPVKCNTAIRHTGHPHCLIEFGIAPESTDFLLEMQKGRVSDAKELSMKKFLAFALAR
jgi:hypothetical protein